MDQRYYWGVDLGGTKIEAVVLDRHDGFEIVHRERTSTEAEKGYAHVVQHVSGFIKRISKETGIPVSRVGIGTPGSLNPHNGRLRNCNSVYLNGNKFQEDLERISGLEWRMTNDANCFAVSEYKLGVIQQQFPEARNVFGVIMGTGVGGGLVIDGEIINGCNGIGGEWGHNFLDASGDKCYCGRVGCVEKVISGPALEGYYQSIAGQKRALKDIVAAYRAGSDDAASETMARLFTFFPRAISVVINIVDPDVIVVGGGLGNIDELYTEGLKKLPEFVFSDYIETRFVKPSFGDSSGVLGAAMLWS